MGAQLPFSPAVLRPSQHGMCQTLDSSMSPTQQAFLALSREPGTLCVESRTLLTELWRHLIAIESCPIDSAVQLSIVRNRPAAAPAEFQKGVLPSLTWRCCQRFEPGTLNACKPHALPNQQRSLLEIQPPSLPPKWFNRANIMGLLQRFCRDSCHNTCKVLCSFGKRAV